MHLGVKDAAGIFNVSEKTIFRWIRQRNLPSRLINEQYRFNRSELLEWATEHRINLSAEGMTEPAEGEQPPRFDKALELGGIFHRVGGMDKASVLGAVVQLIPLPRELDPDFLYQVLLARESLGSTAIGDGIAIPHVRHPIVLHIPHSTITLCFLENAIDFGAEDGRPVDTLFTLVSPTVRAHQHLLSKLAFALKDGRFKTVLARKGSPEEILTEAGRMEEGIAKRAHA